MQNNRKWALKDMLYIAICSALIAVCAWISIPMTVPVTLQTFGVFATVGLLGTKRGLAAVAVYILLGAIGLPVFSEFRGGFGMLVGATGGYIMGFLLLALVMGWIMQKGKKSVWNMVLAMAAGLLVCYAAGTAWFVYAYTGPQGKVDVVTALSWCVIPFLPFDAAKIALAVFIVKRVDKYVNAVQKGS